MAAAKIRKGDRVVVLSGKDKGKTGEVIRSMPKDAKVIVSGVNVPTYQNTTFREGILDTFGVGSHPVNGHYPLYLAYDVS